MSEVVLAFSIVSFIFAYLAVQTPDRRGPLQILNYLMTYLSIFFTGYLAVASVDTGTQIVDVLTPWVNAFFAPLGLVFAYFFITMMATVLEEFDALNI